jgi:protein-S-isoprenylcysteine O-methyltransferase Ste14
MLTPSLSVVGVVFAFAAAYAAYCLSPAEPGSHFYLPIYFLILYYTVAALVANRKRYALRPARGAAQKAIGKYVFWFGLIGGVYVFYGLHPYYVQFGPQTRRMVGNYLWLFALGGLPYFFFVERYRYSTFEALNDPYLRVMSFLRTLGRGDWPTLKYRLFTRGYKSLVLSWVLRLHYLPVMVEQVYRGIVRITENASTPDYQYTISSTAAFLVVILFCIDSTNASMGYFWESSLTGTRFRETDPHPFHWIVCLVCYHPFIRFAGTFFPFPAGAEGSPLLLAHPGFELAVNLGTIAALAGMAYATTSLGFSFSNLSYKRIQTKGLYRVVRHPATVCKLLFFLFAIFRYKSSFEFTTVALYCVWVTIYLTRTVCEERFLRRFAEYRSYMSAVRYRFIPGLL